MDCERSVITMTPFRLDYLVHDLVNCVDDTSTETDLKVSLVFRVSGLGFRASILMPISVEGSWECYEH